MAAAGAQASRRSRSYVFTWNNPYDGCFDDWHSTEYPRLADQCKFLICAEEEGDEAGTLHIQGYIVWVSAKTHKATHDILAAFFGKNGWCEAAKGSADDNIKYVSKKPLSCDMCSPNMKHLFEAGPRPQQGRRSDLARAYAALRTGATVRRLLDEEPSYQGLMVAKQYLTYKEEKRDTSIVPDIMWIYGPTGTGKSHYAMTSLRELTPDDVYVHSGGQWFDGYDGHKSVVFDDLRADSFKFHYLLRLLDRWEMQVPIKGGFRQWKPENIIVTSAKSPEQMFPKKAVDPVDNLTQLLRRINRGVIKRDEPYEG